MLNDEKVILLFAKSKPRPTERRFVLTTTSGLKNRSVHCFLLKHILLKNCGVTEMTKKTNLSKEIFKAYAYVSL